MGKKRNFRCSKCGHVYMVFTGPGFNYPDEYDYVTQEIRDGEYGEEWKTAFENTPYAAVNAAEELYMCDDCGVWEVGRDITVYEPNDVSKFKKRKYGDETVEKLGYVPYVMENELKEDFYVVKQFVRKCPCCEKPMRRVPDREKVKLRCSMCGTVNAETGGSVWD